MHNSHCLSTSERHHVLRIDLHILEHDEDFRITEVIGDRVVAPFGAGDARRFDRAGVTDGTKSRQHSTLKHVLDTV